MTSAGSLNPADTQKRLDGIDLLRGLAILFVLLLHVNIRLQIAKVPYTAGIPRQLALATFWNGQAGVQMFFVVSGFLITSISLRRWGSLAEIRVGSFYWLRFSRIAPLLLLLLAVLTGLHFAQWSDFIVPAKTGGIWRALFSALTFHLNLLEAQRGYLPGSWDVLWSLSVEEMFYLFFPLVCWFLGRSKALVALLMTFIALGPFARAVLTHGNPIWNEKSYLGSMDAIALGCLTALIVSRVRFSRVARWAIGSGGVAILTFCLGFSRYAYRSVDRHGFYMTILATGTTMFIIAAAQAPWKSPRIFTPLLKMGQHSYEIYLTHMFVVFALFHVFVATGMQIRLVPLLFIAVILISSALGSAVARFYSEPMNRFLRNRSGYAATRAVPIVNAESTATP